MDILLIGDYYSSNLGDGVICQTMLEILKQYAPAESTIDILDINGKGRFVEYETSFYKKSALKRGLKRVLVPSLGEAIKYKKRKIKPCIIEKEYDLAVYAGGQLLMPYFIKQMITINKSLKSKKVKIAYNSVGFGTFNSKLLMNKVVNILLDESIFHISFRDENETIINNLTQKNFFEVCDCAVWASEVYSIVKQESEVVGLGIMYIENKKKQLMSFWKDILMILNKKGIKWHFFVNGSIDDYLFAVELLESLGYEITEEYLCHRPKLPEELVELISKFKQIISFRLHSHIIAFSLEIPSIPVVWDEKVKHFFIKIGHENRCFDYHSYNSKLLFDDLENLTFTSNDFQRKKKLKQEVVENVETMLANFREMTENNE